MDIKIDRLKLHCFKNHKELTVNLGAVTKFSGMNGTGKSTIGESIAWCLYGTDALGNSLAKKEMSPEPTTYEFDYVSVELLLAVDDKQILLERRLEGGDTKYYVNEVPAKATPFKELVESLFQKDLFLSLFSPAYFFSQKWEDQRALVLKNVLPPANSDVLKGLPKPQADKLAELLKKHSIDQLETLHKDNKNRQDKLLIGAQASAKTLQEQLNQVPQLSAAEVIVLNEQLAGIDEQIKGHEAEQHKAQENNAQIARIRTQLQNIVEQSDGIRGKYTGKKSNPPADKCDRCGQELNQETREGALAMHDKELGEIKAEHAALLERHKTLKADLATLVPVDLDPDVLRALQQTRQDLAIKIKSATDQERLQTSLTEAKQKERDTEASFKDSVFILDAIKAFRGKEAELMAAKVQDQFQTLTIQLFQENKGDGERKPYFEIYMHGKPYRKLSAGEKIMAGLELIDVLTRQSEIVAPCFIDGAESYTGSIKVHGQAIICRAVYPDESNAFGAFTIEEVSA